MKNRDRNIKYAILGLALGFGLGAFFSEASAKGDTQFKAERKEIESAGVQAFMKSHPYGKKFWPEFYRCVNNAGCLDMVRKLWAHTDGAEAEELTASVGQAISKDPAAIMKLLEEFAPEEWSKNKVDVYASTCDATFEDVPKKELKEMKKRLSALQKNLDKESWKKCADVLEKRIVEIASEAKKDAKSK